MKEIESDMLPVESVLREGRCTPNCLLALDGDDKSKCSCRCGGSYHGALSDCCVIKSESSNWWIPEEVVRLDCNEYVDLHGKGVFEFNRVRRESYGRFGAVVKEDKSKYSVRFDFESFRANGSHNDFDKIHRLLSALLLSRRITGYHLNGDCLTDFVDSYLDPCVDFSVGGIGNFDEAKVIHNVLLDFCYTPYGLNVDDQIERVKRYAHNALRLDINEECTSAVPVKDSKYLCQDFPVLTELAAFIGDDVNYNDNEFHKKNKSGDYEDGFFDAMASIWEWCIDHRIFSCPYSID